jgi:cytochrome c556
VNVVRFAIVALGAMALLSCNAGSDNQANAAGNGVVNSAETRASAPLTRDQAVALMKARHDHMEQLGDAAKNVGRTFQSGANDVAVIRQSAATMKSLAPKLLSWFPAGTGPDVGNTRAKPEIWQKQEDFALKAHDFEKAANDFADAAQSGNMDQVHAAFGGVGKSCKACHDLYRAPEKD